MSEHRVEVNWAFAPNPLDESTYTRNHQVTLRAGQGLFRTRVQGRPSLRRPGTITDQRAVQLLHVNLSGDC